MTLAVPRGEGTPTEMSSIDHYLLACERRNLRPLTIYSRGNILRQLARHLQPVLLEDATVADITNWWTHLTISADSRANQLSNVRAFFRWLVREGFRADDPTARIDRPRSRRRLPRPISDTDLEMAISLASDRIRPWLLLAALAGFRACEIATLDAADVRRDLDPPVVFVGDGKGGKQRVVPLHPDLADALPRRPSGPLFTKLDGGTLTPWLVSKLVNDHLRACRIDATLHQLRHRFATRVYAESDSDLRLTQELMGHASVATTQVYAAWNPTKGATAIAGIGVGTRAG